MRFTLVALTVALYTGLLTSTAEAWMSISISPHGLHPSTFKTPFKTSLNAKTVVEKDPKTSSVSVTITATAEQTRDAYDRVITDASKVRVRVHHAQLIHNLYTTYTQLIHNLLLTQRLLRALTSLVSGRGARSPPTSSRASSRREEGEERSSSRSKVRTTTITIHNGPLWQNTQHTPLTSTHLLSTLQPSSS